MIAAFGIQKIVTTTLGNKRFQEYVHKFNYGNEDISGDKGKKNGLTQSWLGNSLKISPSEQINFLEKLASNKLPVSNYATQKTKTLCSRKNSKMAGN